MVVVKRKKGETKDAIFRKFTRAFIDEEIMTQVRERLFYKKPSQVRKEVAKERLKNKGKRRVTRTTRPTRSR
ncbi:MAG: 30S ribosomal protein S21 [Weeksellaceae bacterium]